MKNLIDYINESTGEKKVGYLKNIQFSDLIGYLFIEDYDFNSSDVLSELGWSEKDYNDITTITKNTNSDDDKVDFKLFKELMERKDPFNVIVMLDKSKGHNGGTYRLVLCEDFTDEENPDDGVMQVERFYIDNLPWTEYDTILDDLKKYKVSKL